MYIYMFVLFLFRIFVHVKAAVHESTMLSSPRAHLRCLPWCSTIPRLIGSIRLPFRPPVFMLYISG